MSFQDWFYCVGIIGVCIWSIGYILEKRSTIRVNKAHEKMWDRIHDRMMGGTTNITFRPNVMTVENEDDKKPNVL